MATVTNSDAATGPEDLRNHLPPDFAQISNEMRDVIYNSVMFQRGILQMFTDKHRNIESECGYPGEEQLSVTDYKKLWKREPLAERVVNLYPEECWGVNPEVCETEDLEVITPFEQSLEDLGKKLRGPGFFNPNEEQGNPLWDYLYRADVLSGIGQYGVIFLGFNDIKVGGSKTLKDPVELLDPEELADKGLDKPTDQLPAGEEDEETGTGSPTNNLSFPPKPNDKPKPGKPGEEDEKGKQSPPGSEDTFDVDSDGEYSHEPMLVGEPFEPKLKLNFIRVLDEELAQIGKMVTDPGDVRFGLPETYQLTLNDTTSVSSSSTLNPLPRKNPDGSTTSPVSTQTVEVHWTRVIHIADNVESNEVLGAPRMRTVYNRLYDLHKLYGGSAEMYWKGAFFGLSFEVDPKLAGAKVDMAGMRQQIEQYETGLQRWLGGTPGLSVKSIAPQVVSPVDHIDSQIQAICIKLKVPKRKFMGSEIGQLASSQDMRDWIGKVKGRQNKHCTFNIICQFIDRLILAQVLPVPEEYYINWPDIATLTELEKADVALKRMQAYSQYVSGGVSELIEPLDALVREFGYSREEAMEILEAKAKAQQEEEAEALAEEEEMADKMEESGLDPFTGQAPPVPAQTDKDGKPIPMSPQSAPFFGPPKPEKPKLKVRPPK